MPRPREEFEDLRAFEFRDPEEVLEEEYLYTVYEIARLLQGLDPDREMDAETEAILLDWAIPWMLDNSGMAQSSRIASVSASISLSGSTPWSSRAIS